MDKSATKFGLPPFNGLCTAPLFHIGSTKRKCIIYASTYGIYRYDILKKKCKLMKRINWNFNVYSISINSYKKLLYIFDEYMNVVCLNLENNKILKYKFNINDQITEHIMNSCKRAKESWQIIRNGRIDRVIYVSDKLVQTYLDKMVLNKTLSMNKGYNRHTNSYTLNHRPSYKYIQCYIPLKYRILYCIVINVTSVDEHFIFDCSANKRVVCTIKPIQNEVSSNLYCKLIYCSYLKTLIFIKNHNVYYLKLHINNPKLLYRIIEWKRYNHVNADISCAVLSYKYILILFDKSNQNIYCFDLKYDKQYKCDDIYNNNKLFQYGIVASNNYIHLFYGNGMGCHIKFHLFNMMPRKLQNDYDDNNTLFYGYIRRTEKKLNKQIPLGIQTLIRSFYPCFL